VRNLFKRRVFDIAAVTDKSLKVKFNNEPVPIKSFVQYLDLYIGNKAETNRIYEEYGERWEYAVALTPNNEFVQVSFVNGIYTNKGGKHVEYILNQILRKLVDYIEKKKKIKVNPTSIKEQIILFVRCDIENPAFDSQTKDYMNTPTSKFGSKCEVSDKFIDKVAKLGIMDAACALTEIKENKVSKKTDGSKSKNVRGIPKLTDANWAGTPKSKECSIIFCEGDSAKAGILSGLSSEDRNNIGVYPMKGKILNVRGETTKKINENKEIAEIKKILGLESGKKYITIEDVHKNLRYGKVLFMTDQDLDGSHIKGLGINLFASEWPTLSLIPGFIGFMNTPILKAKKGSDELEFYNNGEFEEWSNTNDVKKWKIKYYKGLGTSTGKEFKEYFKKKKIVGFETDEENQENLIDMVFNKKRSDDRKDWLKNYNRKDFLDTNQEKVTYNNFINKELIHFSKYDCDRSIPNMMDGLKISQRKILYSAFKKGLTSEIKVAQFSGYVSEHSGYHHGEASLNGAIVGMAQTFVGSNNINLLLPNGQFGTRLQGGKDSASERYIFTLLNSMTRNLFPSQDDNVLDYLDDDGLIVEPIFYAPIIPMVLVNGCKGIGTGFSTEVLCYNPLDIIHYINLSLENKISETNSFEFLPFYNGFKGTMDKINDNKFIVKGKYEILNTDVLRVTELPIGYWTEDFKELLEKLLDIDKKKEIAYINDYDDLSRDTTVDFTIYFQKGKLNELLNKTDENNLNGVDKLFKLYSYLSSNNMHLFNSKDKLHKYNNIKEIINEYVETRLEIYEKRKAYQLSALNKELVLLTNKAKFINAILNDILDLRKKGKQEIIEILTKMEFDLLEEDKDYKYLTKMPMDSLTNENVEKINKEVGDKKGEINKLEALTVIDIWKQELSILSEKYQELLIERNCMDNGDSEITKKTGKKVLKRVPKTGKKIKIEK